MKADLMLHPIRMRILMALAGGRQLTTQGIADKLTDVPQATLYRHLNTLVKSGLVEVVARQQVRGAVEKTYSLPSGGNYVLTQADLTNVTNDEHLQYFAAFLANMLGDFERYLSSGEPDFERDRVGYRQIPLWLTDEEFDEMNGRLREVLIDYVRNPEAPERVRRLFTTIMLPEVDGGGKPDVNEGGEGHGGEEYGSNP